VTFRPGSGGTEVRLVQTGWDRLGAPGIDRRRRTGTAWALITAGFAADCTAQLMTDDEA
jgi:hypothetical protein